MKNPNEKYQADIDDYIMLIRKMAWTFTKKTDLDYKELFSEAALAYSEALYDFDPNRGTKFITFAWWCMKNHLINFCKKETKVENNTDWYNEFPEHVHPTTQQEPISVWDIIETWPEDCREMAETVLEHPEKFLAQTPNFRRKYVGPKKRVKKVERYFELQGWKPDRVRQAVETIQSQLQIV